jgi:hypothetical protein
MDLCVASLNEDTPPFRIAKIENYQPIRKRTLSRVGVQPNSKKQRTDENPVEPSLESVKKQLQYGDSDDDTDIFLDEYLTSDWDIRIQEEKGEIDLDMMARTNILQNQLDKITLRLFEDFNKSFLGFDLM